LQGARSPSGRPQQFWQVETFEESEVLRDSAPEQVRHQGCAAQLCSARSTRWLATGSPEGVARPASQSMTCREYKRSAICLSWNHRLHDYPPLSCMKYIGNF